MCVEGRYSHTQYRGAWITTVLAGKLKLELELERGSSHALWLHVRAASQCEPGSATLGRAWARFGRGSGGALSCLPACLPAAAPAALSKEKSPDLPDKVDIHALGVLLWELVTGEVPQGGALRDPEVPKECPQQVADAIRACCQVRGREAFCAALCVRV